MHANSFPAIMPAISFSDVTRPQFVLGITGNMDPDFSENPRSELEHRLETLLLFLACGAVDEAGRPVKDPRCEGKADAPALADSFCALLADPEGMFAGLEHWRGLGPNTDIILLSSLAPGADTFAVEVFQDLTDNFPEHIRGRVRAPLAFPPKIYRNGSTFHKNPDHPRTEAEKKSRSRFDEIVAALPEEDVFAVYTARDLQRSKHGLTPEYVKQLEEEVIPRDSRKFSSVERKGFREAQDKRRIRRYQAAGEYIATFSDLLIAIYDDRHHTGSEAGSNEVVEAKRNGAKPGLLPLTDAFTWSDNGPALHLYHPRHETKKSAIEKGKAVPDEGIRAERPLRILHPYELCSDKVTDARELGSAWEPPSPRQPELLQIWRDWLRTGNELSVRIVTHLVEFNGWKAEPNDLARLCFSQPSEKAETNAADPEQKRKNRKVTAEEYCRERAAMGRGGANWCKTITDLAKVRGQATKLNYPLTDKVDLTFFRLFVLAFAAAVCLHCFAHWHYFSHEDPYLKYIEPTDAAFEHATKFSKTFSSVVRVTFGVGTLIFALLGLYTFGKLLNARSEERSHDYRTLAEGIRVQFYWALAGLRRSVPANYMQRVRSEMDWIRNAISSLITPCERNQSDFLAMTPQDQRAIFEVVSREWVAGQQSYFANKSIEKSFRLHLLHARGTHLALTGLLLVIALPFLYAGKKDVAQLWISWWIPATVAVIATLVLIALTALRRIKHAHDPDHHPLWKKLKAPKKPKILIALCNRTVFPMLDKAVSVIASERSDDKKIPPCTRLDEFEDCLYHHEESARDAYTSKERRRRNVANAKGMLPGCAAFAVLLLALCFLVSRISAHYLPGPLDLAIIVTGVCLLAGALIIASSEKLLLAEHARQYEAASKLFHSARMKLRQHLDALDRILMKFDQLEEEISTNQLTKHKAAKAAANLEKKFANTRNKIHALLFALGKEALDENSEWLILHRARPLEPVMAG